jgi:hypothetical protein
MAIITPTVNRFKNPPLSLCVYTYGTPRHGPCLPPLQPEEYTCIGCAKIQGDCSLSKRYVYILLYE